MQNANSILKIFEVSNTYTDNTFVLMFMFAIIFIMLFALKRFEFSKAIMASSWSCFLLSLMLSYAELLNFKVVLLFLAIAAFSALYSWTNDTGAQ